MPFMKIALDSSVRETDDFGRLHVKVANISKANICPYFGREIPNSKELGLSDDKVYYLFRDPEELEKAAKTFNNLPLLKSHIPHSADEPRKNHTIGSTGTDAVFEGPYLKNSLVIWDGEAIALVEGNEQKELSCGYAYVADMTPGSHKGEKYDGVMREIVGNHVALVEEGRAGKDVVIGDKMPLALRKKFPQRFPSQVRIEMAKKPNAALSSRKALLLQGAIAAYLQPKLAGDAQIDLSGTLKHVTRENYKSRKDSIYRAVQKATKGKLAADADIADLVDLLDAMSDVNDGNPDEDDVDAVDTERSDIEQQPVQQKPAAPAPGAAPGGGAPAPAGGGGDDVVQELAAAGCPEDLLAKVKAALGGGGGGGQAPAQEGGEKPADPAPAAAAAPEEEKKNPLQAGDEMPEEDKEHEEEENETLAEGEDEDEEDIDGEDESAEELMPKGNDEEGASGSTQESDKDELDKLGECEGGPAKESESSEAKLSVDKKLGKDKRQAKDSFPMNKQAMDAAIQAAVAKQRQADKAMREAEVTVRPYIGNLDVSACDSAADLYKMALEAHDIDVKGVHPSAFKAMVKMLPKQAANSPRIAQDSKAMKSQAERLPGLSRIKVIG